MYNRVIERLIHFSVEEWTLRQLWFSEREPGPWEWKGPVIRMGECFYGKFFAGKAGFVSREWFSAFANYRRDGYDFDALYEDGKAARKDKYIYDTVAENGSLLTGELKKKCNYGKGGNKGFETIITRLQMETYLVVEDFEYMLDKAGNTYGWGVARYSTPEKLAGEGFLSGEYKKEPEESRRAVYGHMKKLFPKFNYLTPQNFGEDASQSVMGTQMGASYAGILAIPVVCGILGQRFCMGIFRGFLRSWEGS